MANGDSIASVTLASTGAAVTAHRSAGDLDSTNGVFSITGSAPVATAGRPGKGCAGRLGTAPGAGAVLAMKVKPPGGAGRPDNRTKNYGRAGPLAGTGVTTQAVGPSR